MLTILQVMVLLLSQTGLLQAQSARSIMSGGSTGGAAGGRGGAANLQNAGAASASLTATRARDVIQKSEATLSAMKALQNNARNLMQQPPAYKTAYNGLDAGGLVKSSASWSGAKDPTVTTKDGRVLVDIKQTTQNAYLYWDKFNIGSKTTVKFDQSKGGEDAGKWIAFNKVRGAIDPSHIYGGIQAQGQVYILNQNGIIFHNGSQVNTHALVASTLPINENLAGSATKAGRGIANNPDSQFLFSALKVPGNTKKKTDAFTPQVSGPIGPVVVEKGAAISSPVNQNNTGGFVALVGANVRNEGTISTPNGQTVLAAGLQVGLTPHNAADPSLRGMDVTVGRIADPEGKVKSVGGSAGQARNDGILSALRGNATMEGAEILQNGGIESSTSTDLNGRIDLLASYNAVLNSSFGTIGDALVHDYSLPNTGTVSMGAGSVLRILPEWESSKSITGTALALSSLVSVTGRNIALGEGSILLAPGAVATAGALSEAGTSLADGVTLQAGRWTDKGGNQSVLNRDVGRIDLAAGSEINVAGSTAVWVDSSKNLLKIQLRGAELSDSSLQKNDPIIRGQTIIVDATVSGTFEGRPWVGTPLGDVSGYVGLIERSVGELTAAGGSVSLLAGDAVSMAPASVVDVSGGWIQYSGGTYHTTKLLYQGHPLDISQATPDKVYSGILTSGEMSLFGKKFQNVGSVSTIEQSSKWGQSKVFNSVLDPDSSTSRDPYVSGAAGGSIRINAPSVALDGDLRGNTVQGPRQLRDYSSLPAMNSSVLSTLPLASSFALDLSKEFGKDRILLSPYAPKVTFASQPSGGGGVAFTVDAEGVANVLPSERAALVTLPSGITSAGGFGRFAVTSHDGDIEIPKGVTLDAGPNGSVSLQGANIALGGEIITPGGSVSLQAFLTPFALAGITLPDPLSKSVSGIMTLKKDAGDLKRGEKVIVLGDPAAGDVTVYAGNGKHATLSGALLDPLQAGRVTLASTGRIDASGRILNDTKDATISPIVLNGGSVTISGYDVALAEGSSIDVSGGFHRSFLSGSRGVTYGNAGSITVSAGQDSSFSTIHQGGLALGGMLSGYAGVGSQAGSLALKAPAFGISEDPLPDGDPRVISLTPDFFNRGGFSSFSLTGVGLETGKPDTSLPGVSVAEGTHLHPRVTALIVDTLGSRLILPEGPLSAAPSLKLAATGLSDDSRNPGEKMLIRGAVEIGKDSVITLDPQVIAAAGFPSYKTASLEMRAAVVSFQGKAIVPGGSITIAGSSQYPSNKTQPGAAQVTVDLGPAASLSVAGKSLFTRDPLGLRPRYGTVLPGGSVALSGNILARAGSWIDASGASSMVNLLPYQLGMERKGGRALLSPGVTPYQLDSAGGSISLTGKQALRSDATLVARSGGKTAAGGSLSITSGRFNDGITPFLSTDLGLAISQSGPVISKGFADAGSSAAGLEFKNVDGIQSGGGHVAVSSFAPGGFQDLTLGGNVFFSGPVSLSVPGLLKVGSGGIVSADAKTELSAAAAVLGTPFLAPLAPSDPLLSAPLGPGVTAPPTWGHGELVVKASRIDLGNLSLQGIGKVSLEAPGGAIRGDGSFVMAGDLTLKAGIIYPVSGTDFRAVAFNHKDDGTAASSGGTPGSITILNGGSIPLPLSAMGSLSLQAETILQSGTLAAPFGTITLGRTDSQAAPPDPLSGLTAPITATMCLADGSVTTVSGMDSIKGLGISVPYGTSLDGISWTDPSGTAITGTGLKDKAVSVAGSDIVMEEGAIVDISGGGSVTARQWVNGLGGTRDLLNDNTGSWAIMPGYSASFTPKGYEEGMVAEGMRINLKQGAAGLAPGTYTLLPASYASQPGAYLLSRSSMQGLTEAIIKPDGTAVLPGTLISGLDPGVQTPGTTTLFEISSPSVIASKAEYRTLNADTFFAGLPASGKTADGGRLQLVASASMNLAGSVTTMAATKGRAAAIDIAATAPVVIAGSGGPSEEASAGTIVLDAAVLSSWKAGSLLIGGTRSITSSGEVRITSVSESITLDAGTRLEGAEVILATAPRTYAVKKDETIATIAKALGGDVTEEDLLSANQLAANATLTAGQILRIPGSHASLRLSDGSAVVSSGGASPSTLLLEGNGALLRVGDAQGLIRRTEFDPVATDVDGATPLASLVLGQDVIISGAGVTFDSTSGTTLDALASVSASALRLSAGLISVNGEDPGALTLSGTLLEGLNSSTILKSLSLTSYSTMILHDGAVLGSDNLGSLAIHAAAITGDGGDASMVARVLSLDNASGSSLSSSGNSSGIAAGKLSLKSDTLALGSGELYLDGFSEVAAEAKNGVALSGKGVFSTAGDLTIDAPVVVGLGGASTGIRAAGDLSLTSSGKNPGVLAPGLGSSLSFEGATVSAGIPILAPSGVISLKSTSGNLELSALLDAGGVAKSFPGVVKYTDAGVISLSSGGDIVLQAGSDLNLSAQGGGGSAGTLRVTVPSGSLIMLGNPFRASKGNGGKGGAFAADLFGYSGGNLDPLSTVLSAAGFTERQDLRIRSGDVTLASATAHTFSLSTDLGSITVNGTIDASGKTGGSISLFAGQSVILSDGSLLNVHGDSLDAAGKGGLIDLEAGSSGAAVIAEAGRVGTATEYAHGVSVIDLKSGSKLKLGVGADQDAGTVLLKAPQTADVNDLQINPIASSIEKAGSIIAVGNHLLDVAAEGPVSIDPLAKWDAITTPLPGQSVLGGNGGAYKLTADSGSYAQFVAQEVAPGNISDPATSSYWTKIAAAWDPEVGYASGAKAVGADGRIYTASAAYPANGPKPEPGTEEGAFAWVLAADEGNHKALALQNAATFDANTLAAARKDFAGAYAESIRVRPGEEIVNSKGGLLLNSDWDLSLSRYGQKLVVLDASGAPVSWSGSGPTDPTETYQMIGREPGLLSLRAAGDITFHGSLSDGFGDSVQPASEVDFVRGLYFAPLIPLLARNVTAEGEALDPVSQSSWSYRITAGADFASSKPDAISLQSSDISIGLPGNPLPPTTRGDGLTSQIISSSGQYQVIRTGTGDISLSASRDVQLLSPFASVYTAGALVTDPTMGGRFDLPVINLKDQNDNYGLGPSQQGFSGYPVQYASGGGNISIAAARDITRLNALLNEDGGFQYDSSGSLRLTADSSLQLPSNWLYRRGALDPVTGKFDTIGGESLSTTWWVDYSNFFQDVGALGGGNIVMNAGRDVANMSASIPTTYRMPGRNSEGDLVAPSESGALELGGGDLSVKAGNNIDAGVYYVERGQGVLNAGGSIITNPTRDPAAPSVTGGYTSASEAWLPTTLFLGKGSFAVQAGSDLRLGPMANVFLTPQGANNSLWYKTYFSSYAADSSVSAVSLAGNVTMAGYGATEADPFPYPLLRLWYDQQLGKNGIDATIASYYVPWIRSMEFKTPFLSSQLSLAPPTLSASALGGGITLQGSLTTAPSPSGDISLIASGGINGLASAGNHTDGNGIEQQVWISSSINLSDASPENVPGAASPLSKRSTLSEGDKGNSDANAKDAAGSYFTAVFDTLFSESGSYSGSRALIETKQALHDSSILHGNDSVPLRLIASGGDISGLTLYSAKHAEVLASGDIADVGLYLQNLASSDVSVVSAGGSFKGYDGTSALRAAAVSASLLVDDEAYAQTAFPSGDIQIGGPGTLEVLAGRDIDLGNAAVYAGDSSIWVGLTSIGNARNPALPFQGADIVGGAGLNLPSGLSTTPNGLGLAEFTKQALTGEAGKTYLSELESTMTYSGHRFNKTLTAASFDPASTDLTEEEKALAQLQLFYIVLRDTGRNYNNPESPGYRSYKTGEKAIAALFAKTGSGNINAWARDIRTKNGGNISLLAPGGGLSLASISTGSSLTPPGIVTEHGGGIDIFTRNNVDIGIGRIFTLRGGDITIWSDKGNIAAGYSAKTVASAPPTRVLIDPQSGDVVTDLAGLATGGGIGVLATVAGIPEGAVDLIAPTGVIDAGDAGIRATGKLNLAATAVLNAANISAGSTSGAPAAAAAPAAPNVSGATAASAASAGNNASAQAAKPPAEKDATPSIISVDVLGYGGGEKSDEDEEKPKSASIDAAPTQASL